MSSHNIIRIFDIIISNFGIYITLLIIGLRIISLLQQRNDVIRSQSIYEMNRIGALSDDTREFHEFMKFIITETTMIKFKKHIMSNELSKTNRTVIQLIISEIATDVFESLNRQDIFDNHNLLTKEYYMTYITNMTIITVDKLLDDII